MALTIERILALAGFSCARAAPARQRVFDPHTHILDEYGMGHFEYDWNVSYSELYKPHSVDDYYAQQSTRVDVVGVQFMEITARPKDALAEAEHWQAQAKADERIVGVIGSVELGSGASVAKEQLSALVKNVPFCRGIRISEWGLTADFIAGFEVFAEYNLTFDVLVEGFGSTNVGGGNLTQTVALAKRFPGVTFVLDHYGYPNLGQPSGPTFEAWAASIEALGSLPNVYAKISGGPMLAAGSNMTLSVASFLPFTRRIVSAFGTSRIMYAGNWFWTNFFEGKIPLGRPPAVVGNAHPLLAAWTNVVLDMANGELAFSDAERDDLFYGNAQKVYSFAERRRATESVILV